MAKAKQFLIDTHVFLWWLEGSVKLGRELKELLSRPEVKVYLSVVSVWEMVIKNKIGRLKLPSDLKKYIEESGCVVLPVELNHAMEVGRLPWLHKDPFDRMLVAQAREEQLILVTKDIKIMKYDVEVWE